MPSLFAAAALATSLVFAATASATAQQPEIAHAQLSTQTAPQGLAAKLDALERDSSAAPLWVAYTIPTNAPYSSGWHGSRVTYLEGDTYSMSSDNKRAPSASDHAILLLRLANAHIDKLRSAAPEEAIDAGGLRLVWLDGITPEDSLSTLKTAAAQGTTGNHLQDSAVFLIALHRSPAALPTLVALAAPASPPHLREQAAFWLASQRGAEGLAAIKTLTHGDADEHFREKLTFDLTLSQDPAALTELIRMAHEDASPRVRQQAQFWMGNRGGKLVATNLRESADSDPDAATRKQAVFAISRLPGEEAATQLIQLADSSKYPEVRKQAIFWLGQSQDPKALAYLTRLLSSNAKS